MFEHSARVYDLLYSFKDYETEARDLTALIRERNPGATSEDGFEQQREVHELTLFSDEAYRAAFAAASLTPDVIASPMPDRDRYVAVAA